MKLLTKAIETAFKKAGYQGDKSTDEINIICKWFNPTGVGDWWVYERLDEDRFMCFANLGDTEMAELGAVSIGELQAYTGRFGLGIERDMSYTPEKLSDVMNKIKSCQ